MNVHVNNSFDSLSALYSHLDDVDLMDVERLRPGWDTYFMVNIGYPNPKSILHSIRRSHR